MLLNCKQQETGAADKLKSQLQWAPNPNSAGQSTFLHRIRFIWRRKNVAWLILGAGAIRWDHTVSQIISMWSFCYCYANGFSVVIHWECVKRAWAHWQGDPRRKRKAFASYSVAFVRSAICVTNWNFPLSFTAEVVFYSHVEICWNFKHFCVEIKSSWLWIEPGRSKERRI